MGYAACLLGDLSLSPGSPALAAEAHFLGRRGIAPLDGFGTVALFPISHRFGAERRRSRATSGVATATLAFLRSLGSALGVAIVGAVIFAFRARRARGGGASPDPGRKSLTAFRAAFALMTVATLSASLCFAAMEERTLRGPAKAAGEPETA